MCGKPCSSLERANPVKLQADALGIPCDTT
jgi:hypothetical protein